MDADEQDRRLRNSGLVFHENQLNSQRYVGPPDRILDGGTTIKRLPLTRVEPKPSMEIHATDGERYILPPDFKGSWFDVVSPKGKELIPR